MRSQSRQHDTENRMALERAIAVLIANTRRVRRRRSLIEIADHIDIAREGLGSLQAVADKVGVSNQQLTEFLAVRRLSSGVRKLVGNRNIDSVDVVRELAKLKPRDQLIVGRLAAAREVTSQDVRAIVSFRRSAPELDIRQAIERVLESRDVKEYVAEFPLLNVQTDLRRLRQPFEHLVGCENLRSLSQEGRLARLSLTREGMQALQAAAKRDGLTKRQLIDHIVREEHK
jgi:hypothetical protein